MYSEAVQVASCKERHRILCFYLGSLISYNDTEESFRHTRKDCVTSGATDISDKFPTTYPNITHFIKEVGTIEIGHHHDFPVTSFIRAIDLGGVVWESADHYPTFDAALADLEAGLGAWMAEMGIE